MKHLKKFNENNDEYDYNDKIETLKQHIEDSKKHIKWCEVNNKPEEHIAYHKEVIRYSEDEIMKLYLKKYLNSK